MQVNRLLCISLLVSLAAHAGFLFQLSRFYRTAPSRDKRDFLEVRYAKAKPPLPRPEANRGNKGREPLLKINPRLGVPSAGAPQASRQPVGIFPKDGRMVDLAASARPSLVKPEFSAARTKISLSLPASETGKVHSPTYMSYDGLVREKIKHSLYQNYNFSGREAAGEVYVSFLVSHEGVLKEARVIEEKSSPDTYLRRIALKSVKDASPFPAFPKELDYAQLPFNVIVCFEIE